MRPRPFGLAALALLFVTALSPSGPALAQDATRVWDSGRRCWRAAGDAGCGLTWDAGARVATDLAPAPLVVEPTPAPAAAGAPTQPVDPAAQSFRLVPGPDGAPQLIYCDAAGNCAAPPAADTAAATSPASP